MIAYSTFKHFCKTAKDKLSKIESSYFSSLQQTKNEKFFLTFLFLLY